MDANVNMKFQVICIIEIFQFNIISFGEIFSEMQHFTFS